jgi:hypothetical protein
MEVLTMMTPAQMDGVYAALVTADDHGDTEALAQICWQLYAELGETRARAETLHARLSGAARALLSVHDAPADGVGCRAIAAGERQPSGVPS